MKLKFIDEIKKLEGPPKIVRLFSDKNIKDLLDLYNSLPITTHNKKQNVIKKRWLKNFNRDLDNLYISKLKEVLGEFQMDNIKIEEGKECLGLMQESFGPIKLHCDGGFDENSIIFKQVLVPLTQFGETVIFKNRWYEGSTSFTIDKEELEFKATKKGQNLRSSKHLDLNKNSNDFDRVNHKKYLAHEDINNLKGMEISMIYKWNIGEVLIFDRTNLHASSCNINKNKIGIATFTKK